MNRLILGMVCAGVYVYGGEWVGVGGAGERASDFHRMQVTPRWVGTLLTEQKHLS